MQELSIQCSQIIAGTKIGSPEAVFRGFGGGRGPCLVRNAKNLRKAQRSNKHFLAELYSSETSIPAALALICAAAVCG